MCEPPFTVREAIEQDIPNITAIQAYYVRHTVLNFSFTPASSEQVQEVFRNVKREGLPYLVAVDKRMNIVVGYCYAIRFRPPKLGYRPTVELSIYCRPDYLSTGIGSLLMTEILQDFQARKDENPGEGADRNDVPVKNVLACMALDETGPGGGWALKRFYERFGFEQVAHLKEVGYKFDRWIDTIYMQLSLK